MYVQARSRGLKVAFKVVEKREASLFRPTLFVVEVLVRKVQSIRSTYTLPCLSLGVPQRHLVSNIERQNHSEGRNQEVPGHGWAIRACTVTLTPFRLASNQYPDLTNLKVYKLLQLTGNTTREAKFDAATNAILKMGDAIPGNLNPYTVLYVCMYVCMWSPCQCSCTGAKYKEGEFPEEWASWVDKNLLR